MKHIRVYQIASEGSIATGIGKDVETGERLAFHGDVRVCRAIAEAIDAAQEEDDLPIAEVEDWQLAGGS